MASEAQKKAIKKYREKLNRLTIDFSPAESDMWEHLQSLPNKRTYIKNLIRADMERREKWDKEFAEATPEEAAKMLFGQE